MKWNKDKAYYIERERFVEDKLSFLLLDKEEDVAMQTSLRNDGMIHPGFSPKVGSLKSKYNVLGNKFYTDTSKEFGGE